MTETSATALNSSDYYANGGFRYFTLPPGTHTIQIQYKRGPAGLGHDIRNVLVEKRENVRSSSRDSPDGVGVLLGLGKDEHAFDLGLLE